MVEVEDVAVEVLDGELADAPGLQLQGFDYVGAYGLEVLEGSFDVFREDPVDRGFEGCFFLAEKEGCLPVGNGADLFAGREPCDLEAENVAVVLLGTLDIHDRQLRYRRTWDGQLLDGHEVSLMRDSSEMIPKVRTGGFGVARKWGKGKATATAKAIQGSLHFASVEMTWFGEEREITAATAGAAAKGQAMVWS